MTRLLLHVCCAPCSTTALERLRQEFEVVASFYNPNIHPREERKKRIQEFENLMHALQVPYLTDDSDEDVWFDLTKGMEHEPEGGKRCEHCYRMRLEKTAEKAKEENIDYFATTLTLSPLKKAQVINQIGKEIARQHKLNYYNSNFKKKNGFARSIELSHEHDLYRQNYCGCVYSQRP